MAKFDAMSGIIAAQKSTNTENLDFEPESSELATPTETEIKKSDLNTFPISIFERGSSTLLEKDQIITNMKNEEEKAEKSKSKVLLYLYFLRLSWENVFRGNNDSWIEFIADLPWSNRTIYDYIAIADLLLKYYGLDSADSHARANSITATSFYIFKNIFDDATRIGTTRLRLITRINNVKKRHSYLSEILRKGTEELKKIPTRTLESEVKSFNEKHNKTINISNDNGINTEPVFIKKNRLFVEGKETLSFSKTIDKKWKDRLLIDLKSYFEIEKAGKHAAIIDCLDKNEEKWLLSQLEKHREK